LGIFFSQITLLPCWSKLVPVQRPLEGVFLLVLFLLLEKSGRQGPPSPSRFSGRGPPYTPVPFVTLHAGLFWTQAAHWRPPSGILLPGVNRFQAFLFSLGCGPPQSVWFYFSKLFLPLSFLFVVGWSPKREAFSFWSFFSRLAVFFHLIFRSPEFVFFSLLEYDINF